MSKTISVAFLLAISFLSTFVWAMDDGSFAGYEAIVSELKATADEAPPVVATEDLNWEDVAIHAGVALAGSWVAITSPQNVGGSGLLKGIEVNFGMNLFTRKLRAEGAFSNYAQEELDPNLKADLKEFELRLVYLPLAEDGMTLRFGTGLAARYMNIDSRTNSRWTNFQATTPSSLFLVGFERKITKAVTFGPEVSYRSAVVADTFDKSSWDASFRLNATF